MTKDTIGSSEPARTFARETDCEVPIVPDAAISLHADGSVTIGALAEVGDLVQAIACRCNERVAAMAHRIACLRAARGGTSDTSQTAGKCLKHPRTKAVALTNEHRSILKALADAQEELGPLLVATLGKMLEVDFYKADLLRCEDAKARKDAEDAEYKLTGMMPEARAAVATLGRLGIREGHWSTMTRPTAEKIAALILADNAEADVGSPDDPRINGPRSRRAR